MQKRSLYREAFYAAETYRQEMSSRLSDDLVPEAVSQWNQEHWWTWTCQRIIEHLLGDAFWLEVDGERFASVGDENPELYSVISELREIDAQLSADDLLPYADRIALIDRWSACANRLLD